MIRAAASALALLALAGPARAHIPPPEVVARAAAEANRSQGRSGAFRFSVAVRTEASAPPVAQGELLVEPSGRARIELRHASGFLERQLRRAGGLAASRDGRPLEDAHPFVPPLWLALASTGGELLTRASELGVNLVAIALGYDGARDCYVLGGLDGGPSLWIDKDSHQVARVDLADGSRVRFLAWGTRSGALLPGTIEVETPSATFKLDLVSVARTTLTPEDFASAWLAAPAP